MNMRARSTFLAPAFLLAALSGCSKTTTSSAPPVAGQGPGPRLEAPQTQHDLGEVDFGQPKPHTFTVKNIGGQPLQLSVERKSCKCAEVEVAPGEIPPGEEGKVTLRWAPIPGQTGSYTVAADLATNDPQRPTLRLEARGQINPLVRVWPEDWYEVDFGSIAPGQRQQREVKVFSTTLSEFPLTASVSHPGIKVATRKLPAGDTVGPHTAKAGYGVTLATTDQMPQGYFRETLTLDVGGAQSRQMTLPIYAVVETGALHVVPSEVEFKQPRLREGDSRKVLVQFLVPGDNEKVEVVRCEPSFLVADPPKPLKRGLWQFTVHIPAENAAAMKLQPDGFFEGRIILRTSATTAQELPIRVKWLPRESGV